MVKKLEARARDFRLLFDASALTKRYADEVGRDRAVSLFAAASELLAAAHCKTEVASALLRRKRDGSLSTAEFERAWSTAQQDFADMTLVPLDAHVERFAFAAMEHSALRGMDALHVGSALSARVDLFVTSDRRQAVAAREMGILTEYVGGEDADRAIAQGVAT